MQPRDRYVSSVSIIVCTRNRAGKLIDSLDAIVAAMKAAPHVKSELIVVDNASTDDTPTVLLAWLEKQDVYAFAIYAPTPGLSRARNAGIFRASHDIIAMTDDDCVMQADYVANLANLMRTPAVIGGRVLLGDLRDAQISLRTGDDPQVYDGRKMSGFLIGANFAFHRAVWETIGVFDERFGAGARFKAAEESDFAYRAHRAGFPVRYEPSLAVRHFHGRREPGEIAGQIAGYHFSEGALYAKHLMTGAPFRDIARLARTGRWGTLRSAAKGMVAYFS